MALLKQEFHVDETDGLKIMVRNTVDLAPAIESAEHINSQGKGGRFGDKNHEMKLMGFIPDEMWLFDPWLIMAKRSQQQGDKAKYKYYLEKFFSVYTAFRVHKDTKYWNGSRAVIL